MVEEATGAAAAEDATGAAEAGDADMDEEEENDTELTDYSSL